MQEYAGYLLLGLGSGAVFAALAMAMVVTYRSSGVINFATGSIGLYAAYQNAFIRQGKLLILVPGLPNTVDLPWTPGFWPALVLALALAAGLGLLLYVAVFRPLRNAPPVARVVASVGAQLTIVLLIVKRLGTSPLTVHKIFPQDKFNMGRTVIKTDRLWFALTIGLVALALAVVFKYTRFGLITRAAAETEKGAAVSRISPTRVAALNCLLASAVAGLAGILIAPLIQLYPIAYSLFIVPALAAAVLGRFELLLPAVIGGFLIGALQSEAEFMKAKFSWFPSNGVPELIPLVMILIVLVVRGKPLPARGQLVQRTLGRAPRPRRLLAPTVVSVAVASAALLVMQRDWRSALILSFLLATISLSLVVVTGYCGQISLAQLTLAGAGAYALSMFTSDWGIPFPIAPIMAGLFATVLGVVVGLPALRVRGLSVAVVTLGLAVAVDAIWFRNTDIVGTGGSVTVSSPRLFGLNLGWGSSKNADHLAFGFTALIVLALVALSVAVLRRSSLGSQMVAVRANERSAAAAGIDVVKVKLLAFAIGSFIAGLGGAMLAYRYGQVTYSQFTPLAGLGLFATMYLAGITSVSGGITAGAIGVAGIFYQVLNQWLSLGDWYQLATSALLVVTIITNPEGLMGPNHALADRIAARKRSRMAAIDDAVGSAVQPAVEHVSFDPNSRSLLEVESLYVAYGGHVAVDGVTLTVPRGAIVGLIGPNGAGKTTMVDALSGFVHCSGQVVFDGHAIDHLKPHQRVKLGLGRTFQSIELYDDLTVEENLEVGLAGVSARRSRSSARERIDRTSEVLGLQDLRHRPAVDLSQGQRQLVSIGRSLVAQPELLLLDEPAAGLDSTESHWLGEQLRTVRDSGVTILMVDHDVNLVLGLCDIIYVLDFGTLIASGTPDEIRNDRAVIEAYLGSTHSG